MTKIIEDLIKIYLSSIDSYNSKIHQTINDKYTIIDRSMIAIYLFIKIIEDRKEQSQIITDTISNYILRQSIYGETGSLSFEIPDADFKMYENILNELITSKFQYKNRIMQKLKYNYKSIQHNEYNKFLAYLEDVAEYCMFQKMILRGNKEVLGHFESIKNKIINHNKNIKNNDYFYSEKQAITNLILNNSFIQSEYGNLANVALNLKDVYRYSNIPSQIPENVLLHSYIMAVMNLIFAEYCNNEFGENLDIYLILKKSLFHDFGEYKGTEIVTHFKNYNDVTKKMFAEIEEKDEKELEGLIGTNLYNIVANYKKGAEGYVSELIDKVLGIMKLWVEVGYFNNNTFIKTINSIYQERFKRFLRINKIEELKCKSFYLEFLREYYIYIKEHLVEYNLEYFFKYFTKQELEEFRSEIKSLKDDKETFLQ